MTIHTISISITFDFFRRFSPNKPDDLTLAIHELDNTDVGRLLIGRESALVEQQMQVD